MVHVEVDVDLDSLDDIQTSTSLFITPNRCFVNYKLIKNGSGKIDYKLKLLQQDFKLGTNSLVGPKL